MFDGRFSLVYKRRIRVLYDSVSSNWIFQKMFTSSMTAACSKWWTLLFSCDKRCARRCGTERHRESDARPSLKKREPGCSTSVFTPLASSAGSAWTIGDGLSTSIEKENDFLVDERETKCLFIIKAHCSHKFIGLTPPHKRGHVMALHTKHILMHRVEL